MSAYLLGMGFKADMGTCPRKLVLLKLIDAAEEDGTKIFPAVETIARAAQCSTRQVQRELKAFLDAGLLMIVRAGGKGPGNTREYAMDLAVLRAIVDAGWDAYVEPKGDTVSPLDAGAKGDRGDAERVTGETNKGDIRSHPTPPDPSLDPSDEREARERAGDRDEEKPDTDRPTLDDFRAMWPTSSQDDAVRTASAWSRLTPQERTEALDGVAGFLAENERFRRAVCAGYTYLDQARWRHVKPETAQGVRAGQTRAGPVLEPFSRPWWVFVHKAALAARTAEDIRLVNAKISLAVSASAGISCRAEGPYGPGQGPPPTAEECGAFVQVFSGGDDFEAWHAWFRARGVNLPRRDRIWCWFPARRPPDSGPDGRGEDGGELARASGV